MKALHRVLLLVGILAISWGFRPIDMRKAMVQFDQAFIPAWLYAEEGNHFRAKAAVFYLEFRWQRLKNQLEHSYEDQNIGYDLQRIGQWLGDAYVAIDDDQLDRAFIELEHVKYEMMALRNYLGMDYYLDGLYLFQEDVAIVTEIAADQQLCLLEWAEFEDLAQKLQSDWNQLSTRKVDPVLYDLSGDKEVLFRQYRTDVAQALTDFSAAMQTADRRRVENAADQLDLAATQLIRVFGSFEASKTFYAEFPNPQPNHKTM